MKRRKPRAKITPVIDPNEQRWRHNSLVSNELVGIGRMTTNATATPLDAYRHVGIITQRQFDAGNWLRDNWVAAGREPRLTAALDGTRVDGAGGDPGEVGDARDVARTKAGRRVDKKLKSLGDDAASCVWTVCCMGEGAEGWAARAGKPGHMGLVVLRQALDAMGGGR
jgi:hypothetical protein